jgi:hypothetical protein
LVKNIYKETNIQPKKNFENNTRKIFLLDVTDAAQLGVGGQIKPPEGCRVLLIGVRILIDVRILVDIWILIEVQI